MKGHQNQEPIQFSGLTVKCIRLSSNDLQAVGLRGEGGRQNELGKFPTEGSSSGRGQRGFPGRQTREAARRPEPAVGRAKTCFAGFNLGITVAVLGLPHWRSKKTKETGAGWNTRTRDRSIALWTAECGRQLCRKPADSLLGRRRRGMRRNDSGPKNAEATPHGHVEHRLTVLEHQEEFPPPASLHYVLDDSPNHLTPGDIIVLKDSLTLRGQVESDFFAVLACPRCGILDLLTPAQYFGVVSVICGSDSCSCTFRIENESRIVYLPAN